jgi:hypothetical protein
LFVGHGFGLAAELPLGASSVERLKHPALHVGFSTVSPTFRSARTPEPMLVHGVDLPYPMNFTKMPWREAKTDSMRYHSLTAAFGTAGFSEPSR